MLGIDPDEDFESSGRELVPFDAALPSLHAYLGDCADLSNTCERCLEDGYECLLPVLSFNELVVTPGCSLPLLVSNSRAHWALEQALSAPAPLTGLLAVVLREEGQERAEGRRRVGCSARIKKLQRHDNGPWPATLSVIAEGASPLLFSDPSFGCCTPACLCRTQSLSAFSSLQNRHSQSSFEQGLMSHMLCPLLKSSCSPSGVINAH
ncbi:hypothetical protein CVIRNUC_008764 [Coccomyxa viridis]|uniref:Lon N-terminal domain-containing protein n=1 Tax=Coccomyxa viridis TaxID=1274662 RepID=A0AAV1IHU0_9CHLO|nr:hypothetical protein CVIRNUC_008764 [Coccomyxa viridis]